MNAHFTDTAIEIERGGVVIEFARSFYCLGDEENKKFAEEDEEEQEGRLEFANLSIYRGKK